MEGALTEGVVFLQNFKDLPDPRQAGKVTCPLNEALLVSLMAVLAGAEGVTDIARFGKSKLDLLRRFLPFRDGTPSHDRLGDIFATLDAERFQRCFVADPDSKLIRTSKRHEYRQAYNAQAVVDADGSRLVLTADVGRTPSERPMFEPTIGTLIETVAPPTNVLGFTRFHLRGLGKVKNEWALVTLAYNCKRLARLRAA